MQVISGSPNESQRILEWYLQRLGRFSCSKFYRLMTEPQSKAAKEAGLFSDGALTYIYECAAEKLTGKQAIEDFTSKTTDWGIETEPLAKAIYNEVFGVKIVDSEYIVYDFNAGGSPDGLIGDDGIIEIKCPFTITSHLTHKLDKLIEIGKKEYYWQCLGYLLITGRQWIDFVSYSPHYPAKLQLVRQRLNASDYKEEIDRLRNKLKKANEYLTNIITPLQ
jgi:YqaJ-like recombinase protein